jgi:hypothetical protein
LTIISEHMRRLLVEGFSEATHRGDRAAIKALLSDEVKYVSDDGGKVPSFLKIIAGADCIANLYWAQYRHLFDQVSYRLASINGEPGLLRQVHEPARIGAGVCNRWRLDRIALRGAKPREARQHSRSGTVRLTRVSVFPATCHNAARKNV